VAPTSPPSLGSHLGTIASESKRLVGECPASTGTILHAILDQNAIIKQALRARTTIEVDGVMCLSPVPTAHVSDVLQATYMMMVESLQGLPQSQAGHNAAVLATWWGENRAEITTKGGSALTEVPGAAAARVFEVAAFEWVRAEPLAAVASEFKRGRSDTDLINQQFGVQVRGIEVRDLVEAVVGAARVLVAECWGKSKGKK
jgi:hypothetical protein